MHEISIDGMVNYLILVLAGWVELFTLGVHARLNIKRLTRLPGNEGSKHGPLSHAT